MVQLFLVLLWILLLSLVLNAIQLALIWRVYFFVSVQSIQLSVNGEPRNGDDMFQLQDTASVQYALSEKDGAGNAVTTAPDSAPVWSVSDANLATVTPAADGMSATVAAKGPLGSFLVQVSASFGGKAMAAQDNVTVIASAVASIGIAPVVPAP